MSTQKFMVAAVIVTVGGLGASSAVAQITIPTVPIGNANNPQDTVFPRLGRVTYEYGIGTTEVTNAQYAAFLNAVAATDTNNLYNAEMANARGGIRRLGAAGSYTYETISGRADNPVNHVSYWDACRFANWLHNGQPTGPQNSSTTEDGAYTLNSSDVVSNSVARNANWRWAVTSENEWYKAAYYQPAAQMGDGDSYWDYPTSSNQVPQVSQANLSGAGFENTRPVRSYAANFNGVFDMAGNVQEWTEYRVGGDRGLRGAGFFSFNNDTISSNRFRINAVTEAATIGFRVSRPQPLACNVADIVAIGGFPPADNALTVDDYTSFINAFAGDELIADIVAIGGFPPADGVLTVDDYTSFINAFAEGCT